MTKNSDQKDKTSDKVDKDKQKAANKSLSKVDQETERIFAELSDEEKACRKAKRQTLVQKDQGLTKQPKAAATPQLMPPQAKTKPAAATKQPVKPPPISALPPTPKPMKPPPISAVWPKHNPTSHCHWHLHQQAQPRMVLDHLVHQHQPQDNPTSHLHWHLHLQDQPRMPLDPLMDQHQPQHNPRSNLQWHLRRRAGMGNGHGMTKMMIRGRTGNGMRKSMMTRDGMTGGSTRSGVTTRGRGARQRIGDGKKNWKRSWTPKQHKQQRHSNGSKHSKEHMQ